MTTIPVRYEGGPTDGMAALVDGDCPETVRVGVCIAPAYESVTRYRREPDPESGGYVYRPEARSTV